MCVKTRRNDVADLTGIGWHLGPETFDRLGRALSLFLSLFLSSLRPSVPSPTPRSPRSGPATLPPLVIGPRPRRVPSTGLGAPRAPPSALVCARFDLERALYGLCHWHGPRTGRPHGWVPTCCCPETRSWNSGAARWKVFEPDGKLFFVLRAFPSRLPLA